MIEVEVYEQDRRMYKALLVGWIRDEGADWALVVTGDGEIPWRVPRSTIHIRVREV